METMRRYYHNDAKRVYYFSMEFLIGRSLMNSVLNVGFLEEVRQACIEAGVNLDRVTELEFDAALGNGGLGRLAACFLDSMATIGLPGYGMGIRYAHAAGQHGFDHGVDFLADAFAHGALTAEWRPMGRVPVSISNSTTPSEY